MNTKIYINPTLDCKLDETDVKENNFKHRNEKIDKKMSPLDEITGRKKNVLSKFDSYLIEKN